MRRFLPKSLLGQVMLVLALGLMVAQAISAMLLYREAEQRRDTAIVSSIAFRLISDAEPRGADNRRLERLRRRGISVRGDAPPPGSGGPLPRRLRLRVERSETSPIRSDERRRSDYETALRQVLAQQDISVGEIAVTRRIAGDDAFARELLERRPRMRDVDWQSSPILVASVERTDGTGWHTARIAEPRRPNGGPTPLIIQALVIYAVLVLLLFLVLRRITRPLAKLTDRVEEFSKNPDRAVLLEESGPADTRRLIAAHNAMEARIAALLDEKDVMLGAIGHDLKTPLAALRVRIESVPDDTQRERMAASIEDITRTLDDILSLARVGRSGGSALETLDLGALTVGIVEEFEDLGDPVTMDDPPRLAAKVQETLLKRAVRNLVSNAVRYGGSAHVSLIQESDTAILRIDDNGPGIPAENIADMMEPFTRGEASRNRATGGAGLGLTLARAIAQQHGGTLTLTNRNEGGLRAEIRLPL